MRTRVALLLLLGALPLAASLGAQERRNETPEEIRARVNATPIGTELKVTLYDGQSFEGELAEVGEESFSVWLDERATQERIGLKTARLKKWIRYEEIGALHGAAVVTLSQEALLYRMRIGDNIRLRTTISETVRGRVEDFDGDLLHLEGKTFSLSEGDVQQIELRVDDPLANGTLIGAGVGVGLVALACATAQGCDADMALLGGLFYAGAGAGLGALFDAMNHGYQVIYAASARGTTWSIAPLLDRDKKGFVFLLSL